MAILQLCAGHSLMPILDQSIPNMQFTAKASTPIIDPMNRSIPCVLMRAGTSRGPFFLREWLPLDEVSRDEALIGAIGASDLLQLDGVGGGSTLNSKVAIVWRSAEPGCDVDYLFAQVGVGQRSVDTRPNCGNMLAGVVPFAIEQGLIAAADGTTTVRVFNVNTRSRIDVTVQTPGRRVTYVGNARIDGVAGTGAPIRLNFLDAWGAVTGSVFPTGRRIDFIDGVELTCIDAAMPLMIVRARDLGVSGHESPIELDANEALLRRLEALRVAAGQLMGLGDVSASVVPKPVLVSEGDSATSVTSRYFTPRRCHASHAATGAIGVATAFALPGTVASARTRITGAQEVTVLHPQGRIDVEVELGGQGEDIHIERAALVRTARKILEGRLHLPDYVFSKPIEGDKPMKTLIAPALAAALTAAAPAAMAFPTKTITIVVPTAAGGANDAMARTIAQKLGPLLGQTIIVDNRAGANGSIASEYVARAAPDGHTLMLGYIATHSMNPALQKLRYDPVTDFEPVGLVGYSPTLLVANVNTPVKDVKDLVAQLKAKPDKYTYASAGNGTAPHFAAELFKLSAGVVMLGVPYKGSAPAISDTIGGQTQFMFPSLFTAYPHIKAGKLRAMAVAGPKRSASLPDVPTMKEAGVDGVDVTQWYAIFAPARTPKPIVDQINKALNQVLADKDVVRRMEDHGADVESSSPEQLGTLVKGELAKWKRVVEKAKLTAD
jgi:2-methylaconitate cis-trans-isomerase PrpF/tripartite-type tricarboxylate transporter receptor subunit TctC